MKIHNNDGKIIIIDNSNSTLAIVMGFVLVGVIYFGLKKKKEKHLEK